MNRRTFLSLFTSLLIPSITTSTASRACVLIPPVKPATTKIDAIAEIKKLRIKQGIFAGGYQVAPTGVLNWYFTNLGLIAIVPRLTLSDLNIYIRSYLNLYLKRLEPDMSIKDINFEDGNPLSSYGKTPSDSDDSYAATFLSLASLYAKTIYIKQSKDLTWWNKNKSKLKNIAYYNLAISIKQNGLTSVFQSPRSQKDNTGYLMDNCESYRGLRDFAEMLRLTGDIADANYFDSFANGITQGIDSMLFDSITARFIPSDNPLDETCFYPKATCQVFPQAFGLVELSSHFDQAWHYLNATAANWQNGHYEEYPWAILGFVAAKRGAIIQAQAQMKTVQSLFIHKRGLVTINELGFYQRTKDVLAGR